MARMIETPKISEILYEEFMEPFGLSAYRLSKEIGVPVSRVQDILHDRRKIHRTSNIQHQHELLILLVKSKNVSYL